MTPYAARTKRLPAPPHMVWDDLVAPRRAGTRAWLDLVDDEVEPAVLERDRPTALAWSSLCPSRAGDLIRYDLSAAVGGDTALSFTVQAPDDDGPDEATASHVRFRLSRLLYADLRESYGQ